MRFDFGPWNQIRQGGESFNPLDLPDLGVRQIGSLVCIAAGADGNQVVFPLNGDPEENEIAARVSGIHKAGGGIGSQLSGDRAKQQRQYYAMELDRSHGPSGSGLDLC